jgi:hypothetical protein
LRSQAVVLGERFIFCYVLDANATNHFQRKMNQHKKARTRVLMRMLASVLDAPVHDVDGVDWQGDFIEAQGFAFLAIRAKSGYPLSWPGTTGVGKPIDCGTFHAKTIATERS